MNDKYRNINYIGIDIFNPLTHHGILLEYVMIILHVIAQVALQSVSIVKLMVCHILIDKPNQVHKHNHQ